MAPSSTTSKPNTTQSTAKLWTADFVAVAIINMLLFTGFNMTTTGIPVYVSQLGGSSVEVGLVTTLATASALVVRPLSGYALDRSGRKGILLVGSLCMAIVIGMFAIFPLVAAILALRFIQGIGWALGSTATSTIAADVIPRKRFAEGMGYYALTGALAVAFAPALAVGLLEGLGAQAMIVVAAACSLAAFAVGCVRRFPNLLDQAKPTSTSNAENHANPAAPAKEKITLATLFERRSLLPTTLIALINMTFATITTFIVVFGQQQGVANISLYFVVYAITTLATRPFIGMFVDRVGYFIPGILACLCSAGTAALIAGSTDIVMFCVAGVLAGVGFGGGMSTFQAMAVSAAPPQRRGTATSTYLFGFDAGIGLGSLVAGALAGVLGYSGMYLAMAVFPLISLIIMVVLGPKKFTSEPNSLESAPNHP